MTRDESRQVTRRRLLDAAATVFGRRGYRRAPVEEIASEAGYTIGALYSNFAGKDEVLLALLEREIARIAERIVTAARAHDDPVDKLRAAAGEWMAFLDEEPDLYALMIEFWTIWVRDDELRPRHAERFVVVRTFIGGLIQEKADEMGVPMRLTAEEIGAAVVALADGLALQHLADPIAIPRDLFPSLLAILIQALESR
ncbi:MAG: TetR/AcrR family transcriptional regulator [Geminicoccales bacterium]